jgi:hypothetical protein
MTFNPGQAAQQAALQAQQAAQQTALRNGAVIQNELAGRLRPAPFEIRRTAERGPRIRPLTALLGLVVVCSTFLIAIRVLSSCNRGDRGSHANSWTRRASLFYQSLNTMEIHMLVVPATRSSLPPLSPLAIDASLSPFPRVRAA